MKNEKINEFKREAYKGIDLLEQLSEHNAHEIFNQLFGTRANREKDALIMINILCTQEMILQKYLSNELNLEEAILEFHVSLTNIYKFFSKEGLK